MAQVTIQQAFELALQHHQAWRLREAENLYRKILAQQPNHVEAMQHLGVIAYQAGQYEIAVNMIRDAIALRPDWPEAHSNLGNALRSAGQPDEAIAAYRRAITLKPDYAELYNNLGNALMDNGLLGEAIATYRQATTLAPGYALAHSNLGNALRDKGELDEAIAACRQAIAIDPNLPDAHSNLGNVLNDRRQHDEAIAAFRQAIALRPGYAEAHSNLGNALRDQGKLDDAIAAYRQAITLRPKYAQAHTNLGAALKEKGNLDEAFVSLRLAIALNPNLASGHTNLGNALKANGQLDDAIAAYRRAVELKPDLVEAHSNLGNALKDRGLLDEAINAYHHAITLRPGYADAHNNLGNALMAKGQVNDAIAAYRQAVCLEPANAWLDSNLILALHYHPEYDPQTIAEEHRRWNRQHAPSTDSWQAHSNDRDPDRRLRIGYVSPDFRNHVVGGNLLPLLSGHDHRQFEIFCYAQVLRPDWMTGQFQRLADSWRNIVGLSDEQVAALIRRGQIDILIDLAGHTADNRLLVFARKPAPVQVTHLGYPNTTGLTAMDYRLTDAYADPPGLGDTLHSEQLVRLPQTNWIYQPPENCPLPDHHHEKGRVTFGCFNNFAKVTETMLRVWARILLAVPGSRLLLKAKALEESDVQQRVRRIFQDEGTSPAQLQIAAWQAGAIQHLAIYNQIDIGLDPFPYHGTTTTCEALWMGVPVISLAGQTHVSRVGVSLLTNVGLTELIAESPEAYISIAEKLAGDVQRLTHLHATLRQRMQQSPLMDAPRFARNIEAAYRRMWQTWCEKVSGKS